MSLPYPESGPHGNKAYLPSMGGPFPTGEPYPLNPPSNSPFPPSNPSNPAYLPSNPSNPAYPPSNPSHPAYPPSNPSNPAYPPSNPSIPAYPPSNPSNPAYPPSNPSNSPFPPSNPSHPAYPPSNPSNPIYPSLNPSNPPYAPRYPSSPAYPSAPSYGDSRQPPFNPSYNSSQSTQPSSGLPYAVQPEVAPPTFVQPAQSTPGTLGYPPVVQQPPGFPTEPALGAKVYPSVPGYSQQSPFSASMQPPTSTASNNLGYPPAGQPSYPPQTPYPGHPTNQGIPLPSQMTSSTVENKDLSLNDVKNVAKKILKIPFKTFGGDSDKNKLDGNGVLNDSSSDENPLSKIRDKFREEMSFNNDDTKSFFVDESDMARFKNQNYKEIKRHLLRQGKLFEDPEFPASSSLLVDRSNGNDFIVSYFGRSKYEENSIKWLRPQEICDTLQLNKNPQMFVGATNRFDINQGEIGNCWFLAAIANLVENEGYLNHVIPRNQSFQSDYAGIFRFRFWRFGEWVEIVIDDRLPTRNGKLIYLRSVDANEFWGALLEKAFAKLHGSYKALEGGLTLEASVDFTGGIPELLSINENMSMSKERLFYLLSKANFNGAFMGAAVTSHPMYSQRAQNLGLQTKHAYTITKVVELRSHTGAAGIPLVRLRNPHGNDKEWRGDWADEDKHWKLIPTSLRSQLGLTFEDDGEFYMSFSDFCKYIGEVEVCHLTPDAALSSFDENLNNTRSFELFQFKGEWSRAKGTSGGCGNSGQRAFSKNPQFFIDLNDPDPYDDELNCSLIVSLLQKKAKRTSKPRPIGFKIYKCDSRAKILAKEFFSQNLSVARTEVFVNVREVSQRIVLPEGRYCFIPCPFDDGDEAEFLLRVFVETEWGSSKQSSAIPIAPNVDSNVPWKDRLADGNNHRQFIHNRTEQIKGHALSALKRSFPEGAKGLKRLKQFYNWARDKDSEFDLLKKIVRSY